MTRKTTYPVVGNKAITIRPIRIKDEAMEAEFVRQLSPQSKHYRFLGAMKELPHAVLKQFCDVDGLHSMAFVATVDDHGEQKQIGVSRYAPNSAEDTREMAVSVADDWQRQGLGTVLAQQLIDFARGQGIKTLYSVDLADNQAMHELADDLGMTATRDPDDAYQLIYSMKL